MSDQGQSGTDQAARLAASHEKRSKWEKYIVLAALVIVLAYAAALLFGIVLPPFSEKLLLWGKTIVERMVIAVPVLTAIFLLLPGLFGMLQIRGAHDARLDPQK